MSHKIDAPATLNVVSEGVQMGDRSLKFAAAKDHKRFALDLALHADIDPDVSQDEKAEREMKDTQKERYKKDGGMLKCPSLQSSHASPNVLVTFVQLIPSLDLDLFLSGCSIEGGVI